MRRGNCLSAIHLMRRIEIDQARRQVAEARHAEAEAERREAQANAILLSEAEQSSAAEFSAWLPASKRAREQAVHANQNAKANLELALVILAAASMAERTVVEELTRRIKVHRIDQRVRDQLDIDYSSLQKINITGG